MSRLITVICIMVVILAASFVGIYYIKETYEEISNDVDIALIYCKENNEEGLQQIVKKLSSFYNERQHMLSLYIRHDEINNINAEIIELNQYTKNNLFDDASVSLSQIKYMLYHLYDDELPSLDNIF